MNSTIEINNIWKVYGKGKSKFAALKDISLSIENGMFGLLGPNGAGKTTLMKILATLSMPTSGKISVFGHDFSKDREKIRRSLGYLPQEFGVFPTLYAQEFLHYIAKLNGMKDKKHRKKVVDWIMSLTNLQDLKDRKVKTFSGGMVRRLGIAQALVNSPKLLIVDEPTTGLDPEERIRFRNLLSELSGHVTIVLSTHIVNDISSTCNDLAILHEGEIVYHDKPANLIDNARGKTWILKIGHDELGLLKENVSVLSMIMQPECVEVRVVSDEVNGFSAVPAEPNLEDAYIYFMEIQTGTKLHEDEILINA
ncbi:ABC transporter ATP-binding protein [candidate division KSB1 bacterium]